MEPGAPGSGGGHALVVPLHGLPPPDLGAFLTELAAVGLVLVLVDNNSAGSTAPTVAPAAPAGAPAAIRVTNANRGGIAGGFNRGVEAALAAGAGWITLLDQDSRPAPADLLRLRQPLEEHPHRRLVVGPRIWDRQRDCWHGREPATAGPLLPTRLLISSGTTFRAADWQALGPFHEGLFIDFVDHWWCFRAQQRGFHLIQHGEVRLVQEFGAVHPNRFCRSLGMQLYSPARHYYAVRNLRWLLRQRCVPLDLRLKELVKMAFKPWLWLLFEPRRGANLRALLRGLRDPLPAPDP